MDSQQFLPPPQQQQQQQQLPMPPHQSELADPDEMQHMWQFLDSTLTTGTTPNGLPPPLPQQQQHTVVSNSNPNAPGMMHAAQYAPPPHNNVRSSSVHPDANGAAMMPNGTSASMPSHMRQNSDDMRETTLNDDDNGMYNELGDVFSMFFNIDSDDAHAQAQAAAALVHAQQQHINGSVGAPRYAPQQQHPQSLDADMHAKVQLARSTSASSSSHSMGLDSISPGAAYPSMSPATMNWLQSLGKSSSSDSLLGLVSPATLYGTPGGFPGSAGANSLADGSDLLERTPSCEIIDWKAYNEAGEKAQKDAPKWRVIPQHGPHADAQQLPSGNSTAGAPPGGTQAYATKPPTGAAANATTEQQQQQHVIDGGLRDHFTRQFQTIKSTVVSLVGALATETHVAQPLPPPAVSANAASFALQQPPMVLSQSAAEQLERATKRLTDDKNKRKAIVSPEYVQYGSSVTVAPAAQAPLPQLFDPTTSDALKLEAAQVASQVPDPTGRRPSKKTLHQTATHDDALHDIPAHSSVDNADDATNANGTIRCKCTGKCRNARCACVKAGFVCGVHCKCVSCANPFVPMAAAGIDIQTMVRDVCLMQFLSKVKDMAELLDSTVTFECCSYSLNSNSNNVVQVKETVERGFTCPHCATHFTYSWCSNRLCNDQKKPRKHCAKCRRCGDHRNEHCDACNHCYFAGVANSFSCSCKGGKAAAGGGVKARAVVPNTSGVGSASEQLQSSIDSTGSSGHGYATLTATTLGGGAMSASAYDSSSQRHSSRASSFTAQTMTTTGAATHGNASTAASGNASIADGLSSADAEKDDACPVQ